MEHEVGEQLKKRPLSNSNHGGDLYQLWPSAWLCKRHEEIVSWEYVAETQRSHKTVPSQVKIRGEDMGF